MKLMLYLALGGLAGTFARYGLQGVAQPSGGTFPVGTLVVNLAGALLLGFLMRYRLATGLAGDAVPLGLGGRQPGGDLRRHGRRQPHPLIGGYDVPSLQG